MNEIYIICYVGHYEEDGPWIKQPLFEYGYFTDIETCKKRVKELNYADDRYFDEEREEWEEYVVQSIGYWKTKILNK